MYDHNKPGGLIWTGDKMSLALQLERQRRTIDELQARAVNTPTLADVAQDLGVITSGLFWSGTGLPGDGDESGIGISGEGAEYNSETWNLFGVNAGALQAGIKASDGKMYAGAGAVLLDEDGISIEASDSPTNINDIKWVAADNGYIPAAIEGYVTGTSPNRNAFMFVQADSESNTATATLQLIAHNFGDAVHTRIQLESAPVSDITYVEGWGSVGNSGKIFRGQVAASVSLSMTTSAQDIISRTVVRNSLGTKGSVRTRVSATVFNNSGANRTYTFTYNFGSYSFAITTAALTASATNRVEVSFDILSMNTGATNTQLHVITSPVVSSFAGHATATFQSKTIQQAWDTSAVDTTADITCSFTILSSANTATQTLVGNGSQDGPYYGA